MSIRDMEERKKRFMANINKNWNASFENQEQKQEHKQQFQDIYWSYKLGSDNIARVKMRLLPDKKGNTCVKEYMYFWDNPKNGRKYYAKCRDFLGKRDDPMTIYKNSLWQTDKENENAGRPTTYGRDSKLSKRMRYVTNVYIIEDENQPENNGKVFLWNMPETFYNIVKNKSGYEKTKTSFGDDDDVPSQKINAYDPFDTGANIILEAVKQSRGSDRSTIDYSNTRFVRKIGPLFDDEDAVYELIEKCHDLDEINTEERCQPVDVLQKRLDYALGHISLEELQEYLRNRSNNAPSEPVKRPVEPKQTSRVSFDDDEDEDVVQSNIDRFNGVVEETVNKAVPSSPVKFDVDDDDDDFDPDALLQKMRASKTNKPEEEEDLPY